MLDEVCWPNKKGYWIKLFGLKKRVYMCPRAEEVNYNKIQLKLRLTAVFPSCGFTYQSVSSKGSRYLALLVGL